MSRLTQYLHHQREPANPDAPRPPMGGARNEALGLLLILVILTLIAAAFFWQAARSRGAAPRSVSILEDGTAVQLDGAGAPQGAGSFSSVRESWQTDVRPHRGRIAERAV
jgi:ferric-dicitrate binding protein FerR (iron transport regulator)